MSKSKARFLAELLSSDGRVIKTKSQASTIVLGDLPTIPNSKLQNSSVTIAGEGVSLGASLTLNTGDVTEHTAYKYYTDARARSSISATGSLSYNSTTGVMSFTMPAQNTSNITEGSNLYFTNARADARIVNAGSANWNTAYGWGNHASAGYVTSSGNTIIGTDTDLSFSGANVLSTIALTDGVITAYTNRVLTLANLGYTGETNATADQTNAEIRAAVEAATDSNVFRNADHSKLDGIATGATNTAAPHYTSAIAVGAGGLTQQNFTTTLKNKLDGIAASANNYTLPFTNNSSNWNTAYGWGNHASAGYLTSYTDTNTHTHLDRTDNRTISPSEYTSGDLNFGFTSWANNNTSPYADFIHMRSYTDSSGGSDNMVMFKKNGKGMRLWQQTFGSSTAYSSYVDIWDTGTLTTTNKANYDTAYGWGNHASAGYTNDQTAAEILTAIKTVDGAGSGLDADLLDGVQLDNIVYGTYKGTFSGVTMNANSVDRTGLYSSSGFTNRPSGTSWTYLDTKRLYQSDNNYHKQFSYDAYNNNMWTRTNNGGTWSSWYAMWNSFNDGSGSGLDADLLDGQQSSYYRAYANLTGTPTIPSLSGYATESYVGTQISNLVDSSPAALNTLNELAAAIGDDASFSTTVTNNIATKLPLAGGTLTGGLSGTTGSFSGAITAPSFSGASFGAASGAPDSTIWAISRDSYPTYGIFYDEGNPDKILYKWNGATKFNINMETGALDTPSTVTASGGNSGNWNTAYGWGNHASASYLTNSSSYAISYVYRIHSSDSTSPDSFGYDNRYQTFNYGVSSGITGPLITFGGLGTGYPMQLTGNYGGSGTGIKFRTRNGDTATWNSWYTLWHNGNDGSGSGLDADLLDGYNAEETAVNNSIVKRDGSAMITAKKLYLNGGNYEGSIVFGAVDAWRTGLRQHDDGDAELRIWAKNANGRVHIATGYDGQPASIAKPTDGFVVDHNNVGIGNFSATDPSEKLHVKGNILMSGGTMRASHSKGHQIGSYNNIGGNGTKSNPIYTIGSSYNPGDAALSNMYGIGYTDTSASFINFTGAASWGMYVAADGDARVWLGGSNGVISSTGQHYVGSNVVWNAGNDGAGSGLRC